jgi:nucleotide-binding universal stress UspA family protein
MHLRTILYPTDYSELSQEAFHYAAEEARVHGARLIIMHAVDTLGPENVSYGEAVSQRQPDGYRQRLWDELHRVKCQDSGVQADYVLVEDDPVEAIVRTAKERSADLIVLGSHGRHGLLHVLGGGVAERVMRAAPCPVLVVKLPKKTAAAPEPAPNELHPHSLSEPAS